MTQRSTARRNQMRARLRATGAACHLCGRAVDYTLPATDPMSFVVDHVQAVARGGRDDITNAAAAHRICNSRRGARDHDNTVRRSGSLDR
jgi:5-methylcytosine-specific restriction endonuclease McrA